MTRYEIGNDVSGMNLGIYEADSENEALDAMARDAGYENYRESVLISATGDETAEELDAMVEKARAEMTVAEVA